MHNPIYFQVAILDVLSLRSDLIGQFLDISFKTFRSINLLSGAHFLLGEIQKPLDYQAAIMDFKVTEVRNESIIVTPSARHSAFRSASRCSSHEVMDVQCPTLQCSC